MAAFNTEEKKSFTRQDTVANGKPSLTLKMIVVPLSEHVKPISVIKVMSLHDIGF
jgi:hypothetical protein